MRLSTVASRQRGSAADSSWKEESSSTTQSSGRTSPRRSSIVSPMLPPTWTRAPPAASTAPSSAVVVVFPLVPVTPATGAGQRSKTRSISLRTGTPRRRALSRTGASQGTPGLGQTIAAPAATSSS